MSMIPTHRGFNRAFDEMIRAPFGGAPYWMNPSDCLNVGATCSEVVNNAEHFNVNMDVSHYKPEEIRVHIEGRVLAVEGHHELKDNHSQLKRSFTRKWTLPEDVDLDAVKTSLTPDGHLVIDAKKKGAIAPARRELPIEHKK